MRFKCCQHSISSFMITDTALSFCPKLSERKFAFWQNYKGENNFIEKYIKARKEFIANCQNGVNIPFQCQNCSLVVDADWNVDIGIDLIGIANRTHCSCNCIYCVVSDGNIEKRKNLNKQEIWDVIPVLKELDENKLLKDNGKIFVAGGECSEYPKEELNWLINFAFGHGWEIEFASSGMFFSDEIANALKTGKASILISPDSGTKEMYEKIKRVKYFDKVWSNIANYIEVSKENPDAKVCAKYIILSGVNDNIDEFKAFMDKCNSINCNHIDISVDLDWLQDDGGRINQIPKAVSDLLFYIQSLNDKRIYSDVFLQIQEKKTSARVYSKNIEEDLKLGNTIVYIILFAGLESTYQKITNTNLYDEIWNNIQKYSNFVGKVTTSYSQIKILYKLMPGINDSESELNSLLEKCKSLSIKDIEIDIYSQETLDNEKIKKLIEDIKFLKRQDDINIYFSKEISSLIDL